jgi:hypothetical protein
MDARIDDSVNPTSGFLYNESLDINATIENFETLTNILTSVRGREPGSRQYPGLQRSIDAWMLISTSAFYGEKGVLHRIVSAALSPLHRCSFAATKQSDEYQLTRHNILWICANAFLLNVRCANGLLILFESCVLLSQSKPLYSR